MSALAAKSSLLYKELQRRGEKQQLQLQLQLQPPWSSGSGGCLLLQKNAAFFWVDTASRNKNSTNNINKNVRRDVRVEALWPELSRPTSVELEPINDCDHLDQILLRAQDLSQPILIDWMASWCRKCIYLKPKLEKLAAEFDTKLKFYYVDINKVSKALVKRGNISKMPTIQIWKDGEMKSEVIGGHKAWVVIEEVREMIKKFV